MLEVFGAIFIIAVGSVFHFMYDWTNHNKMVGFFTAVNESTWEHLKLIITPSFLWLIVEYHFYADNEMLFFAKLVGMIVMLVVIPLIFYTYTNFVKRPILVVDIMSFVIATILGQYVFNILINLCYSNIILKHVGIIGLIMVFLKYITHTYVPDKNFLYKDPITHEYGITGHYIGKDK